jgi:hypothetical protein
MPLPLPANTTQHKATTHTQSHTQGLGMRRKSLNKAVMHFFQVQAAHAEQCGVRARVARLAQSHPARSGSGP